MRTLITVLGLLLIMQHESFAQTEFDLKPSQSMLMTGKGPGQDATINPYDGQDCYALVENLGEEEFSIRIQYNGKIVNIISVPIGELRKVKLIKGHELYLDANTGRVARAMVDYERIKD